MTFFNTRAFNISGFNIATKKAARLTMSMALAAGLGAVSITAAHAQDVTLRGASMFDGDHAFTKTMVKFAICL